MCVGRWGEEREGGKEGGGERESEKINVYLGEMQVKSMQGFFALILYIRIYIKGTLCCCL